MDTLRLKGLRLRANLTVEELAKKSGISEELIRDYEERIQYPSIEIMELLANTLEVSYEQLIGLELTGYPSIDQPWKKYYEREAYTTPLPEGSIYHQIYESNRNRSKETAIEYLKTKVTYEQLFDYIERARNSFLQLGVKPGDIITLALPNIPENVYCVYGLNRIGAIANMVDLRLSGQKLINTIKSVHSRIVICSDVFAENIAAIQDQVDVDHWIVLSPFDSTPQLVRGFLKWKNRRPAVKEIDSRLSWQDFLKLGIGIEAEDYPGKEEDVACIFHTSGTTAVPKAVQMTNRNMNALAFAYDHAPVETKERDRFFSHVPPFLAYNTIFTVHMPLVLKMTVIMVPLAPMDQFVNLLLKTKPNHVGGVTALWREFARNPETKNQDLSFLKGLACGNDTMDLETKREVNRILAEGGCKYKVVEGYGMTEAGSAAISCWPDVYPEDNSIGIPLNINTVGIFDREDPEKELPYGESGEICLYGPSVMPGYYNDPETTAQVLKKHKDGHIWLHSGDLGYMTENGLVYFQGRLKRIIVTYEGFKISPVELEQAILKAKSVQGCCVVGHPDPTRGAGQIPVAFLESADPDIDPIPGAKQMVEEYIQPEYRVREYYVVNKLPMTPNGKIDYRALEERK